MLRIVATTVSISVFLTAHPTASAQKGGFDPLRFVEEDRITQGPYKGGYVVAPLGQLNWYFANLGLRAFVRDIGPSVRTYLNLYIANLQPDRTILDVDVLNPDQPKPHTSDSDDGYAATFISLTVAYARASGDKAWFRANLPVIRDVAERNLIRNRNPRGLTYNFQDPKKNRVALLEDNAEVYGGLADLSDYLASIGDGATARIYAREAATTLAGIRTLFNSNQSAWWIADPHQLGTECYPDAASQVFPEAYRVPVPRAWWTAGYAYLNRYASSWPTTLCPDFPWAILGYVAAIRHDTNRARSKLAHIEQLAADSTQRGKLAIHELGWYRRTRDVLASSKNP